MKRINTDLSDLFFNHDISSAKIYQDGKYVEIDRDRLKVLAGEFLDMMTRLTGFEDLPTEAALADDFLARL